MENDILKSTIPHKVLLTLEQDILRKYLDKIVNKELTTNSKDEDKNDYSLYDKCRYKEDHKDC